MAEPRHPIPLRALEQHIFVAGKTGSGKSNAIKVLVEDLLRAGERVCAVDPTDTWWGLRLTRNGQKQSGLKPVIFGGLHGDLAIDGNHGAAIGEAIATSSTSAIVSTRLMTVSERTKFFTAFAEALLRHNRGPLYLVIDEAHLFAPQQGGAMDPRRAEMLHAANNLVSLGRGVGLRIILISQRPAKMHKDSITQVESLVALRLVHNLDVAAIKTWIGEWADPAAGHELVSTLASLKQGEAWIWSPEIGVLKRDRFPLVSTFDSGRPRAAEESAPLTPIDIDAIAGQLETIGKEVVASDPRRLKTRVAELERALSLAQQRQAAVDASAGEAELARAREEGFAEGKAALEEAVRQAWIGGQLDVVEKMRTRLRDNLAPAVEALTKEHEGLVFALGEITRTTPPVSIPSPSYEGAKSVVPGPAPSLPPKSPPRAKPVAQIPENAPPARARTNPEGLTGPQEKVLAALRWWKAMGHNAPLRNQVAAIIGWSTNSSNIRDRLSELVKAGLVERPEAGRLSLTPAGLDAAPEPLITGGVIEGVRKILSGPQQRVFDTLLEHGGGMMHRDDLATAIGWSRDSSNIRDRLSELVRLEIIERPRPGFVQLQGWLFP